MATECDDMDGIDTAIISVQIGLSIAGVLVYQAEASVCAIILMFTSPILGLVNPRGYGNG